MFVVLAKLRKYLQYNLVYEKWYNKIVHGKREILYFVQNYRSIELELLT